MIFTRLSELDSNYLNNKLLNVLKVNDMMILQKQDRHSIQKYCGFTLDTPWSITKVDYTYKGIKNIEILTEGSSL